MLWARMPVRGLWLWLALVVSRVVMTFVATALHAHVAGSSAPILLLLGVNRLGQAAVVTPRALASGVPFAPEKDGRSVDVRAVLADRFGRDAGAPPATDGAHRPAHSRTTRSCTRSERGVPHDRDRHRDRARRRSRR
ncbi:hypothetical protein ACQ4WX_41820 [Streptomyces lasalocidi]